MWSAQLCCQALSYVPDVIRIRDFAVEYLSSYSLIEDKGQCTKVIIRNLDKIFGSYTNNMDIGLHSREPLPKGKAQYGTSLK
jgi:hypothetical protein